MSPHASDEVVAVAETFATVARTLAEYRDDVQGGLDKIVRLAVENLDACEFAGISLVEKRKDHLACIQQRHTEEGRRDPVRNG